MTCHIMDKVMMTCHIMDISHHEEGDKDLPHGLSDDDLSYHGKR